MLPVLLRTPFALAACLLPVLLLTPLAVAPPAWGQGVGVTTLRAGTLLDGTGAVRRNVVVTIRGGASNGSQPRGERLP